MDIRYIAFTFNESPYSYLIGSRSSSLQVCFEKKIKFLIGTSIGNWLNPYLNINLIVVLASPWISQSDSKSCGCFR